MRIKNWSSFQHFKDRRPPWIKLHRDILEQRDINALSDCSFRVLIGLWLLASEDKEMEGNLPCVDDIVFRLRIEKPKIIKALKDLSSLLIQDDISAISEVYQFDVPETETEVKTEREEETNNVSLVIQYLNEKGGYKYKPTGANAKLIIARLKDYSVEDLKSVIDSKYSEWCADEKMAKYIRPSTLFNDEKFSSYFGAVGVCLNQKEEEQAEILRNISEVMPDNDAINGECEVIQ